MYRTPFLRTLFGLALLASSSFADNRHSPVDASRSQAPLTQAPPTQATKMLTIEDGTQVEVESGILRVPENRSKATDRFISLPYYRFQTTAEAPATPIFLLAGGPGSSWIKRVERQENFEEVRFYQSFADVVVFDQRGGGTSLPEMDCPQRGSLPTDASLSEAAIIRAMSTLAEQCRDQWLAEGVDLKAYNTDENAADVDALRQALGYDQVSLVGGSYGSHLALHMMRRYPETVDRVMLYGIEGPDHTWDDPGAMLATLERIAATAEASKELGPAIPEGGLLAALRTVLQRLAAEPVKVSLERKGQTHEVIVDSVLVQKIARRQAGRRSRPNAWPEMILEMYRGDFSKVGWGALALRRARIQDPMHYMMDCSSGISDNRRQRYADDPATQLLGNLNLEYEGLCELWDADDLGPKFRANVVSDIPALLIHGTWDTSTPIENAREVVSGLSRGHLVEVETGNHGALYNLYAHRPESRQWIQAFLTGGNPKIPATVKLPQVQFSAPSPSSDAPSSP